MKYDFSSVIERRGKDAVSVDAAGMLPGFSPDRPEEGFDLIPMWIADMNFQTSPSITKALRARIDHPLYGYFMDSPDYKKNIINWHESHFHTTNLTPDAIGYENGVHGCVTSCVQTLTTPGEVVFLHTPYYRGFTHDVDEIGRVPVYSELKKDEDGVYRMDFEDMDAKLKASKCHVAIFCSPHNPAGRVWERWELEKAMEIFEKNDVTVISDEIWADLAFPGHTHIPTQMVNEWAREHTIAVYSPSKTFNLAGLVGSYHIIYNKRLRDQITLFGSNTHYNSQNVLSMHALIGAYNEEGAAWTEELRQVLSENCAYMSDFLNRIDGVSATKPDGTYMIYADCTEYCRQHNLTIDQLLKAGYRVGVGWQDGRAFGGSYHIRINAALPFSRIQEACLRMEKYVF